MKTLIISLFSIFCANTFALDFTSGVTYPGAGKIDNIIIDRIDMIKDKDKRDWWKEDRGVGSLNHGSKNLTTLIKKIFFLEGQIVDDPETGALYLQLSEGKVQIQGTNNIRLQTLKSKYLGAASEVLLKGYFKKIQTPSETMLMFYILNVYVGG